MTQEDKDLLVKDISARLSYGVKVTTTNPAVELGVISGISIENKISVRTKHADIVFNCTEVKPYLRPMSSITEEEYVYFMSVRGMNLYPYRIQEMMSENFSHPNRIAIVNTLGRYSHNIDWLNKSMIDYRGLIERGLALEAPEDMYEINKK